MDRRPDGSARLERRGGQLELDLAARPSKPGLGELRQAILADGVLIYNLARSRRRSLALYVGPDGVLAKAPLTMPLHEVEAFLREKTRWLHRRLREASQSPPPFAWTAGVRLPILGKEVTVLPVPRSGSRLDGDRLEVGVARTDDLTELRRRTLEWFRREALDDFARRAGHFATALGVRVARISLSNARSQWGLCHEDGRIRLSWRLYHAPPPLVDYVVAHEVSHLIEMNHSPRFWSVVESIYPDWREARRALIELGRRLPDITGECR